MSDPLIIIPARMGSTSIPRKNFRLLLGMSPLQRAIECAKMAGLCQIIVTTDADFCNAELLPEPAQTLYAPAPLHTNTCTMREVVLDVLARVPGDADQKVLLLQPSQPLRRPKHLRQALDMLDRADSVASVVLTETINKLFTGKWKPAGTGKVSVEQRQNGTLTYKCDGTVYGFKRGWFLKHLVFRHHWATRAIEIPKHETCALDDVYDWVIAEQRLIGIQVAANQAAMTSHLPPAAPADPDAPAHADARSSDLPAPE